MTSIDCPVCGKSVKFSQAQSVDDVWEKHYFNDCSKISPPLKAAKICHKETCSTILGLSNSFRCTKCGEDVCLMHRVPEEHNCASLKRSIISKNNPRNDVFLNKLEQQSKHLSENPSMKNQQKNTSNKDSMSTGDNSLKGSTQRREKSHR